MVSIRNLLSVINKHAIELQEDLEHVGGGLAGLTAVGMSSSAQAVDQATLESIARNRNRLLRLADNIKVRKKPGSKRAVDLRLDPGYTNIEHLVFGTYRQRPSTPGNPLPLTGAQATTAPPCAPPCTDDFAGHHPKTGQPATVSTRCECNAHSPRRCPPGTGNHKDLAEHGEEAVARACAGDHSTVQAELLASGHAWSRLPAGHDVAVAREAAATGRPATSAATYDVVADVSRNPLRADGSPLVRRQQRPDVAEPSTHGEQRIIQVDLQAASRPKQREVAVVYSVQPTDGSGRQVRILSSVGAVPAAIESGIPKPRVAKRPENRLQGSVAYPNVVVEVCPKSQQLQNPPPSVMPTTRHPARSISSSVHGNAHAQPPSFRKSASVSEKMPVKPMTIPVIRNATIHRWSTGPKASQMVLPRSRAKMSDETGQTKPGARTGVRFAEPPNPSTVSSSNVMSVTSTTNGARTADASFRGSSKKCILRDVPPPVVPPSGRRAPIPESFRQPVAELALPESKLVVVPRHQVQHRQPGASSCQGTPVHSSSQHFKPTSVACSSPPLSVPRKDVRPADVLPLSPWRQPPEPAQPPKGERREENLLIDACISPPGMFKDRDITHQANTPKPNAMGSPLSRWVGNTSRESAMLLNELASYAESKLPSRLNEPLSRMGVAAADTWFDSLRRDTSDEPVVVSPVHESVNGLHNGPRVVPVCPEARSPYMGRATNGKVVVTMRSLSVDDKGDAQSNEVNRSPLRKSNSVDVVTGLTRVDGECPGTPRSSRIVNGSAAQHQVGFSPTRSPHHKRRNVAVSQTQSAPAWEQANSLPTKMWMSDIEERDENSSSGAISRTASVEQPDLVTWIKSPSSCDDGGGIVVRMASSPAKTRAFSPQLIEAKVAVRSPTEPTCANGDAFGGLAGGMCNGSSESPNDIANGCNGTSGCELESLPSMGLPYRASMAALALFYRGAISRNDRAPRARRTADPIDAQLEHRDCVSARRQPQTAGAPASARRYGLAEDKSNSYAELLEK
ncbi:hypothetical protein HPB47_003000 [Ixodes persulcatus]|uniref:Uncharacterized protein n=1 Tax=Ixodes persulcatus TaxID=34615 RepID=A0AC60PK02_IXOPE|nr:hypothetical protein HPB47_003000 [Ixodes persulcatus]